MSELEDDLASELGPPSSSEISDDSEDAQDTAQDIKQLNVEARAPAAAAPPSRERKRKRKQEDDDLETVYFRKLAHEDEDNSPKSSTERNLKQQKQTADNEDSSGEQTSPASRTVTSLPLQHETVTDTTESKSQIELEKASRTVFLANVSNEAISSKAAKMTFLSHLSSHLSSLPSSTPSHKIESFRFRSTAYATPLPKKAAFTRGELKEATTHSTNAYCVYSTKVAAREAARRLNGSIVLGRHLRVDEVAHPMKIDHRRCVFVGNLGFVDDETELKASLALSDHPEDKKKAKSKPLKGDTEEGLWVQFAKAGMVESVRVVRDPQTRIGKGFAYVQFKGENSVERALLFDGKKFPPLLPRKLRVTRCKKPSLTALALERNKQRERDIKKQEAVQKRNSARQTRSPAAGANADESALQGRLKKMLGKAGVAEMRTAAKNSSRSARSSNGLKSEPTVFEGQRATSAQGNAGLKLGGVRRKKSSRGQVGKRTDRSKKRAAAYKAKQRAN